MATHSSILAGKLHGQRSLAGYSPWGPKESDTTEHEHACVYIYICIYPFFFTYRLLQKLSIVPCAIQLSILHTALCIC